MTQLITVPFHDDTLYLVEHQGEPYVPVRPINDALGIDWKNQTVKLKEPRWKCGVITTVAQDGKQREMLCLPLRKLPGWLYSISPAKVRPDIRPKLERYQEECDEVLWRYWNEGVAVNPSFGHVDLWEFVGQTMRGGRRNPETIAIPKDEYIALLKAQVAALKAQTSLGPGPRAWTPEEDQSLIDLRRQGLGFARIGYQLGRSKDACRNRWLRIQRNQGDLFAGGAS